MTPVQTVEAALQAHGARGGRGSWTCPAHEDRGPSLSIRTGNDGRALVHCFAGCETADVLAAVGLTLRDLFETPLPAGHVPRARRPRKSQDYRGRMGLPTYDDVFWSQPPDVIDAHIAHLDATAPAPTDDELRVYLDELRAVEVRRG